MPATIHFVTNAADPRLDDYRDLKDHALKASSGKFIAESEPVVRKLLTSQLETHSLFLTAPHLARLESVLPEGLTVYIAPQPVLDAVAGFHVHRGCLAVGVRPAVATIPPSAQTVVVLEDLVDVDNLGAMARHAAAFDADALVLSPRAADPFYRKAVRVSMGCIFSLPVVRAATWPDHLKTLRDEGGFTLIGAVLDEEAIPLSRFRWPKRAAILFGSEGPGLSPAAKAACDHLVTIPMARSKADSLNVATAGALFLYARAAQIQQDPNGSGLRP